MRKEFETRRETGAEPIDDPVEKLLLGAAPDEELEVVVPGMQRVAEPRSPRVVTGLAAARLESVRAFLAKHPEARTGLDDEVRRAWAHADGDRDRYLEALREKSDEVASRAQVEVLAEVAPAAEVALVDALYTYLVEIEGRSAQPPTLR